MKLYVPEIGDQICLTNDWTFDLYEEYRNESLFKKMDPTVKCRYGYTENKKPVTIPKGTLLKIDRIYIRKGISEYSSLTFYVGSGEWKGARFWAKLSDVNNIEFDEAKTEIAIKVSFSKSHTSSEVDRILQENSYYDYKTWVRYNGCKITAKVNNKPLVEITPLWETENLSIEECKLLNGPKSDSWGRHSYTPADVKITKYELTARLLTGEIIGTATTTTALAKKIKAYFKENPSLI